MNIRNLVYNYLKSNAALLEQISGEEKIYFNQIPEGFNSMNAVVYYLTGQPVRDFGAVSTPQIINIEVYAENGDKLISIMDILFKMFNQYSAIRKAFVNSEKIRVLFSQITSGSEDTPFRLENKDGVMNTINITLKTMSCDKQY